MAVVIIPARLAATRLPGKPLERIGNRPLVICVAQQAAKARLANRVVVATDSAEIAAVCAQHGIESRMTRDDHASGTDRVAEAANQLFARHIVNLQGDEPFIDPRDIDAIAETLRSGACLVSLRHRIENPQELEASSVVKVVCNDRNEALYFSRSPIPFGANTTDESPAFRHIGVYGYTSDALRQWTEAPIHALERAERLEQLRALAMGIPITMIDAYTSGRGIDTPEDLAWARQKVLEMGESAFP